MASRAPESSTGGAGTGLACDVVVEETAGMLEWQAASPSKRAAGIWERVMTGAYDGLAALAPDKRPV